MKINLDKEQRKKIAIGAGVFVSIVVIFFSIRAFLSRESQRSEPQNVACNRSGTQATITWQSASPNIESVTYGPCSSSNFPFLTEESLTPEFIATDRYEHSVKIGPLAAGNDVCAAVSGFTHLQVTCQVSSDTDKPDNTDNIVLPSPTLSPAGGSPTFTPTPTKKPRLTPTPTVTAKGAGETLPLVEATSFFSNNPTSDLVDCLFNFRATNYVSQGLICAKAFQEVNVSK